MKTQCFNNKNRRLHSFYFKYLTAQKMKFSTKDFFSNVTLTEENLNGKLHILRGVSVKQYRPRQKSNKC